MRGKQAPRRQLAPDEVYGSETVTKLINYIMVDGKKDTARTLVYRALEELGKVTKTDPVTALEKALDNIKPKIEVRARRIGGSNLQVPTPVSGNRQTMLAMRWLVDAFRKSRDNADFWRDLKAKGVKTTRESWQALAYELIAAHNGENSAALKKKEDAERMAESNRAFAQFSW